jgi:DNA replication protein DnaC
MERGEEPYWLTLSGVNGCGKTMLMRQVFEEAKRVNPGNPANNPIWPPDWKQFTKGTNTYTASRPYCLSLTEGDVARKMRGGQHDFIESIRGDYFIALDELGVARDPTNYVADVMAALAEARLGRWTMFATNLSLNEIGDRMDARITSRMVRDRNLLITIEARDYALRRRS